MSALAITPTIIWLTGVPCSGKTTIATELHKRISSASRVLDGDVIRKSISTDLKPGGSDRKTNLDRVLSLIISTKDIAQIHIAAFVSPDSELREFTRKKLEDLGFRFILVYVCASKGTCVDRDVKGLYKKAIGGDPDILLPGFNDTYEVPEFPDVICNTDKDDLNTSVAKILTHLFPIPKD